MKKIVVVLVVALAMMNSCQVSNVKRAERLAQQEKPDFKEAKKFLDLAFADPLTKNDARTYYAAGIIDYAKNNQYLAEMMLGKKVDVLKKGEALMSAYNYFKKAYDIDQQPNAEGKVNPQLTKKIRNKVTELYSNNANFIGYGAQFFDSKQYEKALEVFNAYVEIPNQPYIDGKINTNDSTYKMIKYYTAVAAKYSKKSDRAIELYKDLLDDNYETKKVYQLLSEEYKAVGDTINQIKVLEDGFKKYDNDPWFLQNIVSIYVNANKIERAEKYLNDAIAKSPNVPEYYYVKGNIAERQNKFEEGKKAFDKALQLKPDMAEAYAGKGRVIYNQAVEMMKKADAIKDVTAYNAEIEKADKLLKTAEPFMEKAVELAPNDESFKQALKTLYYRTDQKKYEELKKQMAQ